MTTAREVKNILLSKLIERTNNGKNKALQVLDEIDNCILRAVNECATYTEIYILRLATFDNEEEKQAYINTLKHELVQNGYTVKFSEETCIMRITWGY